MSERKKARSTGAQSAKIYQLKIVLCHLRPAIWRRLRVPGDINLGLLHAVIQVAMGWTNSHLHQFAPKDQTYSDPSFGFNEESSGGPPVLDEGTTPLREVLPSKKEFLIYEYDFGDSWEHLITVEKIPPSEPLVKPVCECIAGRRACPPDDCGGVPGYEHLLEVIKNPEDEEYDEMMEWLGGEFNPKAFDQEKINFYLRKLKWPRTTEEQLAKVLMQRDDYKGY